MLIITIYFKKYISQDYLLIFNSNFNIFLFKYFSYDFTNITTAKEFKQFLSVRYLY